MNTAELDRLLKQTLADSKLSGTEKHFLANWIERHATADDSYHVARQRALAVAEEQLGPTAAPVLAWLAGVWDTFTPHADGDALALFSPGTACVQHLIREFNTAKHSCDVCVFTITDNRITEAIEAAHRRGVAVRIVSDDEKAHDTGADIFRLVEGGIPCKTDQNLAHMHHKFAIFDRKRLVNGSFNWTRSASEQNEENLLVTLDPALVTAFLGRFEKLWSKFTPFQA